MPEVTPLHIAANRAAVFGTVSRWVIHDLRNPVQAVSMVRDLLTDDGVAVDPDVRASLGDAATRLVERVDILDRLLQLPQPTPAAQPLSLTHVMTFLSAVQASARSGALLVYDVPSDIPAVSGAESELTHALLNLLVNANESLRGMDDGRVEIRAVGAGEFVEITVADNGPGISPPIAESIFDLFVTTKPDNPIAGLGLPVARHLFGRWGASLELQPTVGEPGASFLVRLPVFRHGR